MNKERWTQVERLLDEALELPEAEQSAFVRKASEGDEELETEVLELLRACSAATDLLSEPPPLVARDLLDNPPAPVAELEVGDEVGSYRVVSPLGRGGMGAVYLAERADGFFEKQVALKVVKSAVTSDETLRRFEAERRILARLEHPNIAGILDGGLTPDGTPYFVMDLALGDPIDVFCDRVRFPVRRRVELFRTVCDAVQYAHRSLVIHRDLKPSNILVSPEGEVRLLDFGIATVLEADAPDDDDGASPRLTPEYASPEQVRGEPTTAATDVYALGVVLYELLTGERPYSIEGRSLEDIERVVCTEEPAPPSGRPDTKSELANEPNTAWQRATTGPALARALTGDLDAITMKALAKNPDERYGSATELSEDLRRYLDGYPVRARRHDGRWYRTGKFVRRYRGQVAAVSVAIAALAGGVVATTVQWRTAEAERVLREQEAERAGLAESMLLSTFADIGEGRLGEPIPPGEFVDVARSNLTRLANSPQLRVGLKNKLGALSLNLSQFDAADTLFVEALNELDDLDSDGALARAEALTGLGYVWLRGRRVGDSALTLFEQAYEERAATLSPDDTTITNSMADRGFALYVVDRDDEAISLLRQALERPGPPLQQARTLGYLGDALSGYADSLQKLGRPDEAADTLAVAVEVTQRALDIMVRNGAGARPQYGNLLASLASLRLRQGDAALALIHAQEALGTFVNRLGPDSERAAYAWSWIGDAFFDLGNFEDAQGAYETSWELYQDGAAPQIANASLDLARVLIVRNTELAEAERLLLDVMESPVIESDVVRELTLVLLVALYERTGQSDEMTTRRGQLEALRSGQSPSATP